MINPYLSYTNEERKSREDYPECPACSHEFNDCAGIRDGKELICPECECIMIVNVYLVTEYTTTEKPL